MAIKCSKLQIWVSNWITALQYTQSYKQALPGSKFITRGSLRFTVRQHKIFHISIRYFSDTLAPIGPNGDTLVARDMLRVLYVFCWTFSRDVRVLWNVLGDVLTSPLRSYCRIWPFYFSRYFFVTSFSKKLLFSSGVEHNLMNFERALHHILLHIFACVFLQIFFAQNSSVKHHFQNEKRITDFCWNLHKPIKQKIETLNIEFSTSIGILTLKVW